MAARKRRGERSRNPLQLCPVSQHYFFRLSGGLGTGSAYCFSDLQVLRVRTHLFTRPNFRFSVLRCAIQAASGRTAVVGGPPLLRATDMPNHSGLSHIKSPNARDSRFESWGAPLNSPPPELFTPNHTS